LFIALPLLNREAHTATSTTTIFASILRFVGVYLLHLD
jgi:hypothetical protein